MYRKWKMTSTPHIDVEELKRYLRREVLGDPRPILEALGIQFPNIGGIMSDEENRSGLASITMGWMTIGGASGTSVVIPSFMPKPCTHHMHYTRSIVPHIRPKVFIDNQVSRIKYSYYIKNISEDYDALSEVKQLKSPYHHRNGNRSNT
jgi:hypothetical protein